MSQVISVIEQYIHRSDISTEDGGTAKIAEAFNDENSDSPLYVRLVSYDEDLVHAEFSRLVGKKIRITIEVID